VTSPLVRRIHVEVHGVQRPAAGETVCGDAYVHLEHESASYVALADGLGHGPKAADAARAFCELVERSVPAEPAELVRLAATELRDSRGAVGAVLRIDRVTRGLVFCGMGNIAVRARTREPMSPVCVPGILGRRVNRLGSFAYRVHPDDVIVLHTDGLSARFDETHLVGEPALLAQRLLREQAKSHDDATCVVLRVVLAA
jgi:serine/threonine protein phosphatase PrpC